MYQHDKRIVMTLDAGGTNFVFSAMSGYEEQVQQYCLPSHSDQLERCLETLISGFQHVQQQLTEPAVAISIAFTTIPWALPWGPVLEEVLLETTTCIWKIPTKKRPF